LGLQAHSDREWRELLAEQVRGNARLWFRLAYDILHDAHAAEDVCQQALLRGWTSRDRLRDPAQLRAWIARTVVNESLQVLRRRRVEERARQHHVRRDANIDPPDEPLAAREAVVMGLSALSEPVRAVVALRVMEGMSGNDVKDLLGCSAAQVSRMLHEGLDQLRVVLGGGAGGAGAGGGGEGVDVTKDGGHAVQ
jgi:RNA polymerase sigma-70 factor (ECF subfamily)